jgi:hypothetical protein
MLLGLRQNSANCHLRSHAVFDQPPPYDSHPARTRISYVSAVNRTRCSWPLKSCFVSGHGCLAAASFSRAVKGKIRALKPLQFVRQPLYRKVGTVKKAKLIELYAISLSKCFVPAPDFQSGEQESFHAVGFRDCVKISLMLPCHPGMYTILTLRPTYPCHPVDKPRDPRFAEDAATAAACRRHFATLMNRMSGWLPKQTADPSTSLD